MTNDIVTTLPGGAPASGILYLQSDRVPASGIASLQPARPRGTGVQQAVLSLPELVAAAVRGLVQAEASFTAYDVTLLLRAQSSPFQRPLPHYDRPGAPGVQPEVHRQMACYLISGVYTRRVVYPNGVDPACLYVPAAPQSGAVLAGGGSATYLSDDEWDCVRPLLPPQRPPLGRPNADHRTILAGILWVQRSGRPWRHLPPSFGKWSTAYCRYRRWRRAGLWPRIEAALAA